MSAITNLYRYYLTVFFFLLLPFYCLPNHINGVISNKNGEPLPFASVYIKNTTYGAYKGVKYLTYDTPNKEINDNDNNNNNIILMKEIKLLRQEIAELKH